MRETVTIPYGAGSFTFSVRSDALVAMVPPTEARTLLIGDESVERATAAALDAPHESDPLHVLARGRSDVLLVVDDVTRPTPVAAMLRPILARLAAAGVPDDGIELLIALGTHRPMSPEEQEVRFGLDVVQRYRVTNHDAFDSAALVDLGRTRLGTPILVHRRALEADLLLGIGSIAPHRYCGWSGGGKIIQPGICGEATTLATHLLITQAGVALGVVENPVRAEMEAVAAEVGLACIVNSVLDQGGRCAAIVAGHPVTAHRAGVDIARSVAASVFATRADVVVAGSHPADINMWQAGKALYAADVVAADGATVFLISPLIEGMGEHPEYMRLIAYSSAEITRRYEAGEAHDGLSVAAALAVRQLMDRCEVVLVTDGLDAGERGSVALEVISPDSFQDALDRRLVARGPDARVACLPTAPETLPIVVTS